MRRELQTYLWDIQEAGRQITEFTTGKKQLDYESDTMLRMAVERGFTIVGEAMVRIRLHFPQDFERLIDVPRVVAFRNQLVHQYDGIDQAEVWQIIQVSLPILLSEVSVALENLSQ